MNEALLNKPAGVLIKSTCVDYPGLLAGSFFIKGCNLRCPYCYNINLVDQSNKSDQNFSSINQVFEHLEKRQGILSGFVISGGEPLLSPFTPILIKKAKSLGYKVKIDTNGTLPEKLENLINDKELKPDFIAMDIKTSLHRYKNIICGENSIYYGKDDFFEETLQKSINLISKLPSEAREFRTVLVPKLIKKEDIKNIASFLPKDAMWQFAQFRNENCLNPQFNNILPYSDSEINDLVDYAKSFIPNAALR